MKAILVISRLKIQNANALSSPYTMGFPAMTAWLGAVHALQRKLNENGFKDIKFKSAAVVCHDNMHLHTYKNASDFVYSIVTTGNPLTKTAERPAFIEEARCNINASLAIECEGFEAIHEEDFFQAINENVMSMKMAGGDIIFCSRNPKIFVVDDEKDFKMLVRFLMPGYVIIERRDLMIESMKNGQDSIDAMLDYLKIMHRSIIDKNEKLTWSKQRKLPGWIVPIATGFQGISSLGSAANQRDTNVLHRFAESIVTLGEFKMPIRISHLDQMLWHTYTDLENDLYLCQQNTCLK